MPAENSQPNSLAATIQRLGRNQGRYLGETIQIQAVLQEIQLLALKHGWQRDCFLQEEDVCLTAYHLPRAEPAKRIYLSAGIHGDEPAGPMAVLELLRSNRWPPAIDVWICPCLNPSGFPLNTRESATGFDLNRQYLEPQAREIRAHIAWLEQQPRFDITLCLHEDWEASGFYVYELNLSEGPSFAEAIVERVAAVCPIDLSSQIEGREAHGGIIRPTPDPASRPQWPEAFYLIHHKTRVSCTLEAPSDYPLSTRAAALVAGVDAVMDQLESTAPRPAPRAG
ncbi:MAG: M14 family metallocarboxypeptidase [Verrucomicrobiota bacterium]